MIIESIIIVDQVNGEAGKYTFKPGANLLVSQDNSQGKSSLLKTMYYALGLDIKQFPLSWHPSKMIIKLDLINERTGEKLYIVRVGDLFYVPDSDSSLNRSEYTRWLSKQLNVDMKLTLRATGLSKSISYPSALITPFYVDQDESWSSKLFSSTNEMQMYSDIPKSIFDYTLNITDDKEVRQKQELKRLTSEKNKLAIKRSNVNEVYMDYVNSNNDEHIHNSATAITNPLEDNQKSIDKFIYLIEQANKRFIKDRATRIKLQRDLDLVKKSSEEYQSIFKMLKSDYEYIKSVCKHCNSELTEEQVRTRMEINTDIFEVNHLIEITNHQILEIESKLLKALEVEQESSIEYSQLSKELNTDIELNSIAEYIDKVSKKKSQEEFATIIKELDTGIGYLDNDIKDKRKEIKESAKEARELVEKISHTYHEYVNELSTIMRGSNVNDYEFEKFAAPKSSGVNSNQTYLGIYLAYMRLVSQYGRYKLPFCIDSFVKNETADSRLTDMFGATESYLLSLSGQSIFSAIEEYVQKYMKSKDKFYRVDIGERLLSTNNFKEYYGDVKAIIMNE